MQHLDEGTIHSWLDGALSADEAERVEAHVKECPQCASAVAEARGFIAASSRILTALDHAPRGVVPVAAPKRRIAPLVWRVAATVLVVAAGTLVVVNNRGGKSSQTSSALADRAITSTQPTAATTATERVPAVAEQATAPANGASAKSAPSKAPTIAFSQKTVSKSSRLDVNGRQDKALAEGPTAQPGQAAAASNMAGAAAAPTALALTPSRARVVGAMDAATEGEPLRVVGTPQRIGAKITLYEVTPGDTVTLTESLPVTLQGVVVTGPEVAPMARRATEKSAAKISAPAPSQQRMANAVHMITWTDPATGNTLSLSGRMPEARLQAIRIRIEREKATAAKKNP